MATTTFVASNELTAMSLAYRNNRFIADLVSPRMGVNAQSFKYTNHTLADSFTIPSTLVGRKGRVNEIDWTATEVTVSTKDYGLGDTVPNYDIETANANRAVAGAKPVDPLAKSTMLLTELLALDREKRVADAVFATTNYAAANRTTLSGTSQWSDITNSNPIKAITDAFDTMLIRPNIAVFGQATWSALRQHPKVTAALYPGGGNASAGATMASRQALADLLELDEIIVGTGWYNSAKPGQTATLTRLWGKHAAFHYRPQNLVSPDQPMFSFTGQWGGRVAGSLVDADVGLRGGVRMKVGESVVEVFPSNVAGYYFQDAVA